MVGEKMFKEGMAEIVMRVCPEVRSTDVAFWHSDLGLNLLSMAYPTGVLPMWGVMTLSGPWTGNDPDIIIGTHELKLAACYWQLPLPEDYLTRQAMLLDLYHALRVQNLNLQEVEWPWPEIPHALDWVMGQTCTEWHLLVRRGGAPTSNPDPEAVDPRRVLAIRFHMATGVQHPIVALLLARFLVRGHEKGLKSVDPQADENWDM